MPQQHRMQQHGKVREPYSAELDGTEQRLSACVSLSLHTGASCATRLGRFELRDMRNILVRLVGRSHITQCNDAIISFAMYADGLRWAEHARDSLSADWAEMVERARYHMRAASRQHC